jgi:hypothetical protein
MRTTDAMKERTKFVLEWERLWKANEGRVNMSELCREFGISRPQGYLWVKGYVDAGHNLSAIVERSRRPLHSPTRTSELIEARLVAARKKHPRWGPRKLRRWLLEHYPDWPVPNASTIGSVLERAGLTARRGRRRRGAPIPGVIAPFASCDRANATWRLPTHPHRLSDPPSGSRAFEKTDPERTPWDGGPDSRNLTDPSRPHAGFHAWSHHEGWRPIGDMGRQARVVLQAGVRRARARSK